MADGKKSASKFGNLTKVSYEKNLANLSHGKVQPQALPLEEAVLGSIMLDKDGLPSVI